MKHLKPYIMYAITSFSLLGFALSNTVLAKNNCNSIVPKSRHTEKPSYDKDNMSCFQWCYHGAYNHYAPKDNPLQKKAFESRMYSCKEGDSPEKIAQGGLPVEVAGQAIAIGNPNYCQCYYAERFSSHDPDRNLINAKPSVCIQVPSKGKKKGKIKVVDCKYPAAGVKANVPGFSKLTTPRATLADPTCSGAHPGRQACIAKRKNNQQMKKLKNDYNEAKKIQSSGEKSLKEINGIK